MKQILGILTKNVFFGVIAGALTTMVLQSSSATTVMVIGLRLGGRSSLIHTANSLVQCNFESCRSWGHGRLIQGQIQGRFVSVRLGQFELVQVGLHWVQLDWNLLGRIRLDQIRSDQIRLDQIRLELRAQSLEFAAQSVEFRAQSVKRRAQSLEHRAQSLELRAYTVQRTAQSVQLRLQVGLHV